MQFFLPLSMKSIMKIILNLCPFLIIVCAQIPSRTKVGLRIIVPESNRFKSAITNGIRTGNMAFRRLRTKFNLANVSPSFNKYQLKKNEPLEILDMFCLDILENNVNSLFHMNIDRRSAYSKDYIQRVAEELGYPLFSWDPDYSGALESDQDKMVLQMGPTIYHQSQAMLQILQYFNWTHFTVISSSKDSYFDFFGSVENLVRENNEKNVRPGMFRYSLLSKLVFEVIDDEEDEKRFARMRKFLLDNVLNENRIFLIHASPVFTKDLLKAAKEVKLTEPKYMWILSAKSIDVINKFGSVSRDIPLGTLGITYRADTAIEDTALKTAIKKVAFTWGTAITKMSKSDRFPDFACENNTFITPWRGGYDFYKILKSINDPLELIAYTDNGISKYIDLQVVNVQETTRRQNWIKVGDWLPVRKGRNIETTLKMAGITWPGKMGVPPRGRPERRHFRIGTLEEEPYVMYRKPDETTNLCVPPAVKCRLMYNSTIHKNDSTYENGTVEKCCTGLCIDLLSHLSERMEFDYDLFEVPDQTCGVKNEATGQWNGLIRLLQDKKADMVITSLQITPQRANAVQFSTPYLETGTAIIVALRQDKISATAVLEPYDYPAWCLILVFSVHSIGASIFIFEWLSPRGLDQGKTPMREHTFSLFRSFWLIWAMLFGASVSADNPRGVSSRFLGNVWALFALVFLASYTANLAAFMITKETYYDLSGLSDWRLVKPLQHKPPFKFATVPNGSTEENLRLNHKDMFQYMKKYNRPSVKEAIKALKKGDIQAFIYDSTPLQYQVGIDKTCQLMMVGQAYAMTGYGVALPTDTPDILKDEINKIILNLQDDGELERLRKFWLAGPCHSKYGVNQSSDKLGILNFTSAFILLASGIALGGLLLIFEHMYFRFGRRCLKKYDKCGCCALVSLSMGKSLTFEQSVMDAIDFRKKHRCKDPLCETQLWKVRHELDLALLKIEKLNREIRLGKNKPSQAAMAIDNQAHDFENKQKESERQDDNMGSTNNGLHKRERSMRRSPSYTQAITSPNEEKERKDSPKYRQSDGKYYVNVDTEEA